MIVYRSSTDSDIVEIDVQGAVGKTDLAMAFDRFQADVARCGKVKVLETIGPITGVEPAALWLDLQRGIPMMNKVKKAAVVTDQGWVAALTNLSAAFVGATVRQFPAAELAQARAWLNVD